MRRRPVQPSASELFFAFQKAFRQHSSRRLPSNSPPSRMMTRSKSSMNSPDVGTRPWYVIRYVTARDSSSGSSAVNFASSWVKAWHDNGTTDLRRLPHLRSFRTQTERREIARWMACRLAFEMRLNACVLVQILIGTTATRARGRRAKGRLISSAGRALRRPKVRKSMKITGALSEHASPCKDDDTSRTGKWGAVQSAATQSDGIRRREERGQDKSDGTASRQIGVCTRGAATRIRDRERALIWGDTNTAGRKPRAVSPRRIAR